MVVTGILVFVITVFSACGRCSSLPSFRSLCGTVTQSHLSRGDLVRTADEDKHPLTWAKVVLTAHPLWVPRNVSCYGQGREIKL